MSPKTLGAPLSHLSVIYTLSNQHTLKYRSKVNNPMYNNHPTTINTNICEIISSPTK